MIDREVRSISSQIHKKSLSGDLWCVAVRCGALRRAAPRWLSQALSDYLATFDAPNAILKKHYFSDTLKIAQSIDLAPSWTSKYLENHGFMGSKTGIFSINAAIC